MIDLVLLTFTLFSRSYADSFFKNDIIAWATGWDFFQTCNLGISIRQNKALVCFW